MPNYMSRAFIAHLQDKRINELTDYSDLRLVATRDYLADYLDEQQGEATQEDLAYYEAILCEMNDRGLR